MLTPLVVGIAFLAVSDVVWWLWQKWQQAGEKQKAEQAERRRGDRTD